MDTNTLTAKTDYHLLVSNGFKPGEGTHRGTTTAQHLYNKVSGTPTMVRPDKTRHLETVGRHKNIPPLILKV